VSTNLHSAWAALFLRALVQSGVRDLVISPGSRSTPLCLAAAQTPGLRTHTHVDERVAAFFALGISRATGAPTALLCTSGTAGAHWLPAVIEASQAHHPLVLITADRPWEAYNCAAPQTIDQTDLFGRYVRHRAELGLPDPDPGALRAVVRIAAQSAHAARWPTPGPVHVNARFRKPLEPVSVAGPEAWAPLVQSLCAARVYAPSRSVPEGAVEALAEAIARHPRGVVSCGPSDGTVFHHARALAEGVGYPLLAEATSGVRFAPGSPPDALDLALRSRRFRAAHAPTLFIELGLPPTAASYASWCAEHADAERWVIAPHGWPDPQGDATHRVFADDALLTAVLARLPQRAPGPWIEGFARASSLALARARRERDDDALHELNVAGDLVDALDDGDVLVAGNSMPVRDLDVFAHRAAALRVVHQRGASGIDGTVAGAAGLRAVSDPARRVAVLLGDITLLHDLGGLNAARGATAPLVIVAVQNDGGRIFAQLPLGRQGAEGALAQAFQTHFITAQGVHFEGAAAMFGVRYRRVETRAAYREALREALTHPGATLLEAVVPGDDATRRRAAVTRDVCAELDARW
jgi:2-succinyl-5-enolpyruvyl-6-hydroxy-3-cyclohexene-1-carboxylate synthase